MVRSLNRIRLPRGLLNNGVVVVIEGEVKEVNDINVE